jgi:hypothetical protein
VVDLTANRKKSRRQIAPLVTMNNLDDSSRAGVSIIVHEGIMGV